MRRHTVLLGAVALAVVLVALANVFARQTFDLMAAEAGGFVAFVNSIGVMTLSAVTVGVVIAWRVPENRIGPLLIVGALLAMGVFVCWPLSIYAHLEGGLPPSLSGVVLWWANVSLLPAMFILFPTVGLLFPDGRLPDHRWRWPYRGVVALLVAGVGSTAIAPWTVSEQQPVANPFALPGVSPSVAEVGGALAAFSVFLGFALAVAGMAVRFGRGDGVERAQLKWLIATVALMGVAFPISFATDIGPADLIDVASVLVGALMPVAIGVAILRYRLYEIDRLISRTVSWALVTGVLLAVFATLVIGLQALLVDVTQGQTLAVAASTLVAFALFQPVRRRVQAAVDHRFDRARYDGERTAAAFGDRLRDQVDLLDLEHDLRRVAEDTVRPKASGVWIRSVTKPDAQLTP